MIQSETVNDKRIVSKRIVLEELRRVIDGAASASERLDGKLHAILQAASIVIALLGLVQITAPGQHANPVFVPIFVLVLILYLCMFLSLFVGLNPHHRKFPVSVDWDEIKQLYFGKDEDAVLNRVISDSLHYYDEYSKLLITKKRFIQIADGLFLAILALLMFLIYSGIR